MPLTIMGQKTGPTACGSCFLFFAYPDILASHFIEAMPTRHGDFYVRGGRFPCARGFPTGLHHHDAYNLLLE